MATTTPNLGLVKPDYEDLADIAVLNGNSDIIDTAVKAVRDNLSAIPASSITSGTLNPARVPNLQDLNGVTSIAKGGTGQSGITTTDNVSSIITAASGFTITGAVAHKWGPIMMLTVSFSRNAEIANNAIVTVGTVKSGFLPRNTAFVGSNRYIGTLSNGGSLQVRNVQGSAIVAGTAYAVSSTFVLL